MCSVCSISNDSSPAMQPASPPARLGLLETASTSSAVERSHLGVALCAPCCRSDPTPAALQPYGL